MLFGGAVYVVAIGRGIRAPINRAIRPLIDAQPARVSPLFDTHCPISSIWRARHDGRHLWRLGKRLAGERQRPGRQRERGKCQAASALRLADQIGLFLNPELAVERMRTVVSVAGVEQ